MLEKGHLVKNVKCKNDKNPMNKNSCTPEKILIGVFKLKENPHIVFSHVF